MIAVMALTRIKTSCGVPRSSNTGIPTTRPVTVSTRWNRPVLKNHSRVML